MTREQIYAAITAERDRQQKKFGDKSIAGDLPLDTKLRILVEEVGEVARAIDDVSCAQGSMVDFIREHLAEEIVQVAACAVGMLEGIDRYCRRPVVPTDRVVLCKHFQAAVEDGVQTGGGAVCRACYEVMGR